MTIHNLMHDLRTYLSARTWSLPLFGLRPTNRELLVGADTDIVIEGYPRCANTFTVVAFRQAQDREVRVAHHLHAAAQILVAHKRRIPAILLIRDPVDAIVSLKIRHPELDAARCLRDYLIFYGALKDIAEYPVIADFAEITGHFDGVIREVNRRFATRFSEFDNSPEAVQAVFAEIDAIRRAARRSLSQIATPNAEKDGRKAQARDEVICKLDPSKLERATELYRRFMSLKLATEERR